MENNEDKIINSQRNKKIIVPLIMAVFTMLILAVGATYAYISVTANNNFGTQTIKGTIPPIGSVALSKGQSLSMEVTRQGMMKENPKTYYATSTGISDSDSSMQTISTAQVTGEGTFTCDYTLNAKATGELFTKAIGKGTGLLTLEISDKTYDFNETQTDLTSENGLDINGQFTGLTASNTQTASDKNSIQARFKLQNSETADQTDLNGKSGTITFSVKTFTCTATE